MDSLSGKVAIVTGGSSGIGKAIVERLNDAGSKVYNLDRSEGATIGVKFLQTDVSDQGSVQDSVSSIISDEKSVDILINNAGIAHIGNAVNTSEEDFEKIFNVNVKGVYNCLHAVIPHMVAKGGVIVNMASIASVLGISDRFAYSMSKGAVYSMTLSVAKDFLKDGIRCNSIGPARIHTPFVDGFLADNYPGKEAEMFEALSKTQPIGRMGKPEEVAAMVAYLCSDEASFITGTHFPIDGGFTTLNS